jgi:uncharacterized protein
LVVNSLNLVLKFTERCNLNCSYCYYFNGLDKTFKERPALLSMNILEQIVHFLSEGIEDLEIRNIGISIHGGEPLLMAKNKFITICDKLYKSLFPKLDNFSLSIQTNGVLIDKEWIKIFEQFKIKVGISLDGPAEYHDKYRLYHSGKGSYYKVEKAIRLLQSENYDFGILSVIDPANDPEVIYNHFTKFLGITGVDFLWPDFTHDRLPPIYSTLKYGEFITQMFKIWTKNDDPKIQIRFLNSYLGIFLGKSSLIYGVSSDKDRRDLHLITIRSNGEIGPTDELMSTNPSTTTLTNKLISDISLKEFLQLPIFTELTQAFSYTPDLCRSCCWENCCRGGGITNRFSSINRFNNPSIYCDGLKLFFTNLFQYLIESGIPYEHIEKRLIT